MEVFFKAVAVALVAVVVYLLLSKRDKEFATSVTLMVCAALCCAVASFIEPVLSFIHKVTSVASLDGAQLGILLRAVGISMIANLAGMICRDAGNETLAKMIELLSTATVIWLSLPLMQALLELLERMLSTL